MLSTAETPVAIAQVPGLAARWNRRRRGPAQSRARILRPRHQKVLFLFAYVSQRPPEGVHQLTLRLKTNGLVHFRPDPTDSDRQTGGVHTTCFCYFLDGIPRLKIRIISLGVRMFLKSDNSTAGFCSIGGRLSPVQHGCRKPFSFLCWRL